ncbi:MAG: phosphatase PAP2 family protein, partial [Ktedonobacterales bacterium]
TNANTSAHSGISSGTRPTMGRALALECRSDLRLCTGECRRHDRKKGTLAMTHTTRDKHKSGGGRLDQLPERNAGRPQRNPPDPSLVEHLAQEREPRHRALRRGRLLLAGYSVVLLVVLALTLAAHTFSILPGDLPFTRELQETTNPIIAGVLTFISAIGYPTHSALLLAVAVVALWVLRLRLEALFLVVSLLADALGGLLKVIVGRHRPQPSVVHVVQQLGTASFPSGHTLHYTVFYGFLIFVVATNFRPSWPRTCAIIILAVPIALVGVSRVYLGEHWPTDVVGGYLIGALCLVPLIAGYMWTKQRFAVASRPPFLRRA